MGMQRIDSRTERLVHRVWSGRAVLVFPDINISMMVAFRLWKQIEIAKSAANRFRESVSTHFRSPSSALPANRRLRTDQSPLQAVSLLKSLSRTNEDAAKIWIGTFRALSGMNSCRVRVERSRDLSDSFGSTGYIRFFHSTPSSILFR